MTGGARVVLVEDGSVGVGELVRLSGNIALDEAVLATLVEDEVHDLVAGTANVRVEHDIVLAVAVEGGLVDIFREELGVVVTAVNVLLVLHRELDDEGLALVAEGLGELGRDGVETGILAGVETCRNILMSKTAIPTKGGQDALTKIDQQHVKPRTTGHGRGKHCAYPRPCVTHHGQTRFESRHARSNGAVGKRRAEEVMGDGGGQGSGDDASPLQPPRMNKMKHERTLLSSLVGEVGAGRQVPDASSSLRLLPVANNPPVLPT